MHFEVIDHSEYVDEGPEQLRGNLLEENDQYTIRAKVVLIGDSGVGKSTIFSRFTQRYSLQSPCQIGQHFSPTTTPQFASKQLSLPRLGGHQVVFNMWDTPGLPAYQMLSRIYLADATLVMQVFDLSNRDTFTQLKTLQLQPNCMHVLVGNKSDLHREVSPEEAEQKAREIGAQVYVECTCKREESIYGLFTRVGSEIPDERERQKIRAGIVKVPQFQRQRGLLIGYRRGSAPPPQMKLREWFNGES
ncbi:hypothetical protein FGO68_gene9392 [Halteria grandinella]|uniref:GTP-binding protein n=1 Tax=Halteria grandinella TaxID=5974 RepID=A0A8J8SZD7_HALGN|nr:hypothetical protein FGO68_gene9392 [Halteria grandinella]